ncbi:MAG: glutathione S-transferase C-terminal domain-containing protein [Propionibacteriaceae bacterium]|jgi:putative glutathione S-transferase|nr:glutathione S-transferase C-terminal domain-containing protein [Propionibacteriaceae bacterium]
MTFQLIDNPPEASATDFEAYPAYSLGPGHGPSAPERAGKGRSAGVFAFTADGTPIRPPYPFQGRIDPAGPFPPAPDRYVLYVSYACPWAHRQLIVRELKGLQDVIGLAVVDPVRDSRGWAFRSGPDLTRDSYNGFEFLRQAYDATEPGYPGHISVPVLWDTETKRIVSNNFPDISLDLGSQFNQWAANPGLDLYPAALRDEIDELNQLVYDTVNNGVYKAGLAQTQVAYEKAARAVFDTLDRLEARLADRVYLFGDDLTEADIRLWVTLARFDAVYVTHFKTNLRRLADYDNLWDYARYLWQQPAFGSTTKFDHIKRHYFITHDHLNPRRIVPIGFESAWSAPTRRGA